MHKKQNTSLETIFFCKQISVTAAHHNIKPCCCKLPYYCRVLNNRTCTPIFFQPNFRYVRFLLGIVRLLLWTNFLSCTFILNCMVNHFEHFISNSFNNNNKKKTLNLLLFVRL